VTTRVIVVDDQKLVRAGFVALLDAETDIEVVGEAGDGADGLALVDRVLPDVALVDVRMPRLDGLEMVRRLRDRGSPTAVIVITTFDADEYVFGALQAGAAGFLLKDTSPEDLLAAIRVVAAGDALLAPAVTRRVIETFATWTGPATADPRLQTLTDREREVLELVARGLPNPEIAEELFISVGTVKTHVARIMAKLEASSRAQLVVVAYESGLVVPGDSR